MTTRASAMRCAPARTSQHTLDDSGESRASMAASKTGCRVVRSPAKALPEAGPVPSMPLLLPLLLSGCVGSARTFAARSLCRTVGDRRPPFPPERVDASRCICAGSRCDGGCRRDRPPHEQIGSSGVAASLQRPVSSLPPAAIPRALADAAAASAAGRMKCIIKETVCRERVTCLQNDMRSDNDTIVMLRSSIGVLQLKSGAPAHGPQSGNVAVEDDMFNFASLFVH